MKLLFYLLTALALSTGAEAAERRYVPAVGPRSPIATQADLSATADDGRYPARVYEGARQLGLSLEFVHYCREGLDLLFQRRYRDTRTWFTELQQEFPGTAVQPIAEVLVYQSMMLENFDFQYDAQYKDASKRAKAELTASAAVPGNDGWEQFMLAGMVGLEAIYAARQGRYLAALPLAFEAMQHVEGTRAAAPTFVDIQLADGLYNYWRSVIATWSSVIPDIGDRREEGIRQIQAVEAGGIFLATPATLAMVFSWLEEKRYDDALASCLKNRKKYPNNLINEQMTGFTYLYLKRYEEALAAFEHVRKIDSSNKRVGYYRGVSLYRLNRFDEARVELETFVAGDIDDNERRAMGHFRLGQVYEGLARFDDAALQYRAAVKLGDIKDARVALDKLVSEGRTGG